MKKTFLNYLSICLIFFSFSVFATAPSSDLTKLLGDFQSLTAKFEQTIYDANNHVVQKSSGTIALSRPGKFRWEVTQPNPQLLIADGKYLWIYDADLAQATRQKFDKNKANSPASLLSGSVQDLESRFHVTRLAKANTFKLVPNDPSDLFNWIELAFINDKLSQMRLSDNMGSLSVFKFSSVDINPHINPALFEFNAPPGVDVIKN